MNKTTYLILALFCAFTFQNCQIDDDLNPDIPTAVISSEEKDEIFKSEYFGDVVTGNFIGTITNQAGNTLDGVQISIGNTITTTDHNGVFIINNADVFENFAHIKAIKEGYIKGSRVVIPKTEGVNTIKIVLLKKEITGTVHSGESSQVSLPNGTSVSFDGNFISSDGTPYTGSVDVVMHYIAPNTSDTFDAMPGSLFAQNTSNDARSLETYGMLSVNLYSPSGEPLNIDKNNPAIIEFPIDDTQTTIAPESINLWYFDDVQGYWKAQGVAIKQGNTYVGEVSHFTWWNCDIPIDFVTFCFSITQTSTGPPPPFISFNVDIIRSSNNQLIFSGSVSSGMFSSQECGLIPENEDITVLIYSTSGSCNGLLVHEETFGPYTADTTVNITFPEVTTVATTTITGTVTNCLGAPITNGYLYLDADTVFSITDGTINFGIQHCANEVKDIIVFDFDSNEYSNATTITLNGATIDIGALSTCNAIGGVYTGDVHLTSQAEIDYFGLFGYTGINGNLLIGIDSETATTDIVDITPLSSLESVTGFLAVVSTNVTSIQGLENITTVGGDYFAIYYNDNLTSISASDFSGLTTVDQWFYVGYNPNLSDIEFNNLVSTEKFEITNNPSLISIKANNLNSVSVGIGITDNNILTDLGEFNSLTNITGSIGIFDNNALITLQGLINLTSSTSTIAITRNNSLSDLTGLNNLTSLGRLSITENQNLMSLTGLNNLTSTTYISSVTYSGLLIEDNPSLTSLTGLENMTNIEGCISILGNNSLTSISELVNVDGSRCISVMNNATLASLTGLNSSTQPLRSLIIRNNDALLDLSGLDNISDVTVGDSTSFVEISGNDQLVSLNGLENLVNIDRINIGYSNSVVDGTQIGANPNPNLTDLCALQNLFINGTYNTKIISNNAYNPTEQDIIDGNCSL